MTFGFGFFGTNVHPPAPFLNQEFAVTVMVPTVYVAALLPESVGVTITASVYPQVLMPAVTGVVYKDIMQGTPLLPTV